MFLRADPSISAIITTFNEGQELHRTLASVIENTRGLAEVIVVDDGSNDGSCDSLPADRVRVIRHHERIGVARSRDEGSRIARGAVLCYLDAHQRIGKDSLDRCAKVAIERRAITCPDVKDYGLVGWRLHGAQFRLCPKRGYFSGSWRRWFTLPGVKPVTGLRVPPYLIPRDLYEKVAWSSSLRGWGASEASVVVKAFFVGIPIYHIAGPLVRHRFQSTFSYPTSWDGVWRNQAIIARVCFDDATWSRYWLPKVFDPHLSDEARAVLESPEVQAERELFHRSKVRADRQFWTDLLRVRPPSCV